MSGEDKVQLGASPSPPNPLGYTTTTTSSIISLDPYSGSGGSKPKPSPRIISYRECLKNHAASIGGNVTDGCGEFMPSGDDGTLEALKCAACNCHRNFHRREHHAELPSHSHSHWSPMPMVKMAFVGSDSSSEELNFNATFNANAMPPPPHKKRFRTKFSTEQKDKMLQFADKLGWRIPREDDTEVQRFCAEVGVKRQVFKVWMHNNKTSSKKTHDHHHHPQQF